MSSVLIPLVLIVIVEITIVHTFGIGKLIAGVKDL